MDIHQFFLGNSFDAHTYFGAHVTEEGVVFRTLAPNAAAVDLIWEGGEWEPMPMKKVHDGGVYELTVLEAVPGQMYKYRITPQNPDGDVIDHCDPYGFGMELRPNNASIIRDLSSYTFHDKKWLAQCGNHRHKPVNIYEVHLGSWRTNPNDPNGWYTYEEIAPKLVDYVKKAGYNYIEFMPLSEHPADCSWGYQNTGFFSPTSRYGTAHQLMQLIDTCHQAGIGVILDFVPVHFAVDGYALNHYDGTTLYEYPEKEDNYSEWGSCNFIHARGEVCSFLQSCANYWMDVFHFDGLRMDAVSRLIYWGGDPNRGTNPSSINFLKRMNQGLHQLHPEGMLIAEDSTNYEGVTCPVEYGGLGFDYKWDMGWMNDTLHYMQTDFPWRPGNHGLLTFSIMYAFTENFICPLSHDEVVHGKCSLIGRMPGDWWRQFAGLRTLAFYQMTHPGAKLNFMGNEIGQFIEWRYYESIQWFLTEEYETHRHHQAFIKALNHLYTAEPALYERGYTDDGFTWIDADNSKQSIVSFVRQGEDVDDDLVILINFDPESYESFRVGVPREGDWEVIFDSDRPEFGGSGYAGEEPYTCSSEPYPWNGQMDSIEIKVPGLAGVVLKRRGPSSYKPPVIEEPKKAARKRTSSVKPKTAAAKKAPVKPKSAKPAAKATAKPKAKKATNKKAAPKAKTGAVKASGKDA